MKDSKKKNNLCMTTSCMIYFNTNSFAPKDTFRSIFDYRADLIGYLLVLLFCSTSCIFTL